MPHDPQTRPEECCPPPAGEIHRVLHQILTSQHTTNRHLAHMEKQMASLQQSLDDLTTAVNTAVTDLGGGVQALKDQLAKAQTDLAALQVQDDADKAALTQSLTDSQAAADTIESQVGALNAATGTTPPAV